jgi:hypothetical protein
MGVMKYETGMVSTNIIYKSDFIKTNSKFDMGKGGYTQHGDLIKTLLFFKSMEIVQVSSCASLQRLWERCEQS